MREDVFYEGGDDGQPVATDDVVKVEGGEVEGT